MKAELERGQPVETGCQEAGEIEKVLDVKIILSPTGEYSSDLEVKNC